MRDDPSMAIRALKLMLTLFAALAVAQPAQAVLTIKITKGEERALPIAVVPFGDPVGAPVDVAAVVAADLDRSGRFAPLPAGDMPARPTEIGEVNFADWRLLGMESLVVGRITPTAAGDYDIEFRLLDVYRGSQLAGYRVPARAADLRMTAHQIADIIYEKLTGQPGAFATRIAYVTVEKGPENQRSFTLQVADSDGHSPQTLLRSPEPLLSPAWSPDGRRLAYVSFEGKNSAVYIQDLQTGAREAVASNPGINSSPAWSPDGNRLALTLSKDGNPEVYVLHLEGRRLQRITNSPAIDTEAAWHPDGMRLLFTSDRGGGPQVYESDLMGGSPKRITFEGRYNARPRLSPDGKLLAVVHSNGSGYRIAVQNLRDGSFNVLTDGRLDESPSFAPNGAMIIYSTIGPGGTELAAVSVDGRVRQRLALQEGEVREPAWGPLRR